jgi:hypothetical protein
VPNPDKPAAGLAPFTDSSLVESLHELLATLSKWEWVAATESPYEEQIEEIGELVVKQLQTAAAALAACSATARIAPTAPAPSEAAS